MIKHTARIIFASKICAKDGCNGIKVNNYWA